MTAIKLDLQLRRALLMKTLFKDPVQLKLPCDALIRALRLIPHLLFKSYLAELFAAHTVVLCNKKNLGVFIVWFFKRGTDSEQDYKLNPILLACFVCHRVG